MATFTTQAAAKNAGTRIRAEIHGKGWKVRTWENLGWHTEIYRGSIGIYPYEKPRGGYTYSPAFDPDCQADGVPSGTPTEFSVYPGHFDDPNDAIRAQVQKVRDYMHKVKSALERAERDGKLSK